MSLRLSIGAAALALVCAAMSFAQTRATAPPDRLQLKFDGLSRRAAQVSEVSLDGPMLQVGIRMLSQDESDAQARSVLAQLQGVYIKTFRFDNDGMYSDRDLDHVRRQLQAPGWNHIISVHSRSDHKNVDVYVLSTEKGVKGMAIIAAYPRELRVVNLVGPIDPAALSQLGGHFGIPCLPAGKGTRDTDTARCGRSQE